MQLRLEARRLVLALMPLRELASRIAGVERDEFGHYWLILRGLRGPLKVSRAFSHLFRPM